MDQQQIKEKLCLRISPLTTDILQAVDFTTWYIQLGPRRVATILRELMDEERALAQSEVGECERQLLEIKIAKNELDQVVGE